MTHTIHCLDYLSLSVVVLLHYTQKQALCYMDFMFIIPHFTIAELGNIGMGLVHLFVCLFVYPSSTFLHDGWMNFLHIWYHGQVPWAADECKIEFGPVPHFK